MKKYRLKKKFLVVFYILVMVSFIGAIFAVDVYLKEDNKKNPEIKNINKNVIDNDIPVINVESTTIGKPHNNENVKILKEYYDYTSNEEKQENSILYYESTYLQNTSVAYGGVDSFEVVSILDGKVINVKKDELLGNIIEIEHDNNIVSVYQSVSEIKVKKNQIVKKGEVIALSGESNINKDLKSHLLFELLINNNIVNPENYIGKSISNLSE